ncbi:sulfite dehydrogenase [Pseudoduganella lutea]|uniref:Sulfite dehydrogenase n=1 Tax=Pseudoduganella lutea TaxID=321985 RepID=A0A4P6KTW1_9BURK|nr:sulfite dehydrogenase [Pseudoduganella lutea]QBE62350.1 sulfite dehydrogenase [Pseudoduganella lutea]
MDDDRAEPGALAPESLRRRRFMARGAVASLAAAGGAAALPGAVQAATSDNLPPNVPRWMREPGAGFLNPAYGVPSPFEQHVLRKLPDTPPPFPTATRTPLQSLFGTITPNGLFFERHHAGVPPIDPAQHRLMVHGLVERPLLLDMKALLRFPAVSRSHFIECSGNSMAEFKAPGKGSVQDIHGLISGAEWTGVRLADVLAEAGLLPSARWVLAEGADAAAMTRSVPLAKALDDALLVYGQNGEMLRPEQGYPLRLLLPGFEGNMSIKWLRRLKVGDAPFHTREETAKYTDLMPDGTARLFTFPMGVKSVITAPSARQVLEGHGFREITGLAWSGHGRITRVDVSVDGGRHWGAAALDGPVQSRALTRFRFPWVWTGQEAILQSRGVDEGGNVQPTRSALLASDGQNSAYHYNAIQSWQVASNGEVGNVHV